MTRRFVFLVSLVLLVGISSIWWATEGFRIVTSEGARRLAVERTPKSLPDVQLMDQDGNLFSLSDYRGRTLLVEFIYTRCPTICSVLGDDFHRVLTAMKDAGKANEGIDLLSISFDPENDNREALKLYGERHGAMAPRWRIAVPVGGRDLTALMRTFGVVVIPDGAGGFVHNSAIYVVDTRGRLVRILDPEGPLLLTAVASHVSTQ